jgi:phage tail-like protein
MATILNNRSNLTTDPIRNFRFLVTFKPHDPNGLNIFTTTLGFTSVSGLSVTTDSIPYREGGYNTTVHQIPGQTAFSPITLQRGVILGTHQNWDWMKRLFQTVQSTGSSGKLSDFRCDIEIKVLSHPIAGANPEDPNQTQGKDHVAMRFQVYNAWITSVAYSDLNAGDNALFVEQMALVHEGFDVNWATDLDNSAPFFDALDQAAAAANAAANAKAANGL